MKFAWNLHEKIDLFETQLRSRGLTEAGEAIGGHIGVLFRVERRRFVARVVDGQRRVGEFLGSDEPAALHLLEATKMFDILFRWKDSLDNLIKLEFSHSIEQFHHCAPVGLIVHLAGLEDEQVAYLMALCVHSGLHFSIRLQLSAHFRILLILVSWVRPENELSLH